MRFHQKLLIGIVFQTYFIMNVRRIISTLTLKHLLVCDYHRKSLSRVLAGFKCESVAPSVAWMFTLTPKYTFNPHPKCNQCGGGCGGGGVVGASADKLHRQTLSGGGVHFTIGRDALQW